MNSRHAIFFLIGLVIFLCPTTRSIGEGQVSTFKILDWPRMRADKFGCYLEETFGSRDSKFNCSLKNYVNHGDPCTGTDDNYYEGPIFPKDVVGRIHPLVTDVDLEWEHGDLRSVTLEFKKRLSQKQIIELFNLPKSFSYPEAHKNIMSISIQNCRKGANCLTIDGFEHQGAGDVECPE